MCLIVFALAAHPHYKFVLAANRDEFYARPTATAEFWRESPQILAGRDLAAGGTWLGITKHGRFAAVTNYRDPLAPAGIKSRGDLTKDFLIGEDSAENYLRKIEREKADHSGFNLLIGDFAGGKTEIFYLSNRAEGVTKLNAGTYGLSNHLLDTDWHKVAETKPRFAKILHDADEIVAQDLLPILADRTFASDEKLPDTGVGIERERILSPAFIETESYGTRSSTVLTVERSGRVNFIEKTFVGTIGEVNHQFAF